ncbi:MULTISPECIES: entry exclusion protein TrbK [unclassified Rhizobium]|uniref:entry exclusion protein TrbK n=1 Tax=unclassified Rhizobium TaxID=2613769 RepID=UPI0006F33EC5|nr:MULTISPECIES: entry exclusion protein TrbK [unclassified Rhizobium]KQV39930.1 entry exclusion protein TrbK [Rhizobium sp. Root1212]KRD31640.1 entry exclusion protein TrbK [Rhizobium sp. Root268]
MSRPVLIVVVLAIVAAAAFGATFYLVQANAPATPEMGEEQRITREKFFGTAKELPPIENGQEMRPRW